MYVQVLYNQSFTYLVPFTIVSDALVMFVNKHLVMDQQMASTERKLEIRVTTIYHAPLQKENTIHPQKAQYGNLVNFCPVWQVYYHVYTVQGLSPVHEMNKLHHHPKGITIVKMIQYVIIWT